MASPEFQQQPTGQERVGTIVKWGGVIGGLIGVFTLNLPLAVGGGVTWLGGRWIENTGKKQPQAT